MVQYRWIFWLNEKHIQEGLDPKNLRLTKAKYGSDHRKHRHEPKKTTQKDFYTQAIKLFTDSRTTPAHKSRTRLGFKQS